MACESLMLKRPFDFCAALFLLAILLPILALVGVAALVAMGPPVLLRQVRPGRHGCPFVFYKFRTMTDARDINGHPLPDEQRLTPFGRFLRRTSLDELPQLFNVVRGDMSLVGPRPLLMEYLPLYSPEQRRRHEVRPGITGWAQVNGRNAISWEEKFEMDIWYIEHQSFALDLRVLAMTVIRVFVGGDINQPGVATMEKFSGTRVKVESDA